MDDIKFTQEPSDKVIADSYLTFGEYVNSSRHIPSILDGLKPSYRRLIQTAYTDAKKYKKTYELIGANARINMHGDAALKDVVTALVKANIFNGHGNFGLKLLTGDVAGAAATRYTEVMLNPVYREQFDMTVPYITAHPSYTGAPEWDYLPTPIPFGLVFGVLGIGVGIGTKIPPFTMKSLLEAYKNDNPDLLQANYDYIISDRTWLKNLWENGEGRLEFKFKMEHHWDGSNDGFLISGDPELFNLDLSQIDQWRAEGKVMLRDDTDAEGSKVFIARVKNVRAVTDEMIEEELNKIIKKFIGYRIRVTYNDVVYQLGIKDWISLTYNNYVELLNRYKLDHINKLNDEVVVWTYFKQIAKKIIQEWSYEDIASELQVPITAVEAVGRKQINTLQTADPKKELKRVNKDLQYFENINTDDLVEQFVEAGTSGSAVAS